MSESKDKNPDLDQKPASPEELQKLRQTISAIKKGQAAHDRYQTPLTTSEAKEDLLSLEEETSLILQELTVRISFWEKQLNSVKQTHPRHLEIMALFHKLEKVQDNDSELDVFGMCSEIHAPNEEIAPIFDLLDKELESGQRRKNFKSTFSETKTIDRTELEREFLEFEKKMSKGASEENDNSGESYEFDYEEFERTLKDDTNIPFSHPPFSKVLSATIIDLLLILLAVGLFFYYKNSAFREIVSLTVVPGDIMELLPLATSFLIALTGCWVFGLFFFSVLYDGSPGQRLLGIVISNRDGSPAKIRQLFFRFLMHIATIFSFGIRPLLMSRKKNGFYCRFSSTYLALKGSMEKDEADSQVSF